MSARLATGVRVAALRRRIEAAGGFATVLDRGDETAGALLIVAHHRGTGAAVIERVWTAQGYRWTRVGPQDAESLTACEDYARGRRRLDPDLWLLEADVADAERLVAETLGAD